jgi:hypothetical protein
LTRKVRLAATFSSVACLALLAFSLPATGVADPPSDPWAPLPVPSHPELSKWAEREVYRVLQNELNPVCDSVCGVGELIEVALVWRDNWLAPCTDYDLYLVLYSEFLGQLIPVAWSEDEQSCTSGQSPLELVTYLTTEVGHYFVAIRRFSGNPANTFPQIVLLSPGRLGFSRADGSITAPADSVGALAVGAVPFQSPSQKASYSSEGPTWDGRVKPDIAAPAGVSTWTYAHSDPNSDTDTNAHANADSQPHPDSDSHTDAADGWAASGRSAGPYAELSEDAAP